MRNLVICISIFGVVTVVGICAFLSFQRKPEMEKNNWGVDAGLLMNISSNKEFVDGDFTVTDRMKFPKYFSSVAGRSENENNYTPRHCAGRDDLDKSSPAEQIVNIEVAGPGMTGAVMAVEYPKNGKMPEPDSDCKNVVYKDKNFEIHTSPLEHPEPVDGIKVLAYQTVSNIENTEKQLSYVYSMVVGKNCRLTVSI